MDIDFFFKLNSSFVQSYLFNPSLGGSCLLPITFNLFSADERKIIATEQVLALTAEIAAE